MNEELTGSKIITHIGKELYGEDFSLADMKRFAVYEKVFKHFMSKSKKGITLIGSIGVGKSACLKTFQRMLKDSKKKFKWVNAAELKDLSEVYEVANIKEKYGYELKCDLCIDDIGIALDSRRYGNTINIVSEIIFDRYELFVSSNIKTHLTSNLPLRSSDENIASIKKIYGDRIVDRIREMSVVINWNGDSLRS